MGRGGGGGGGGRGGGGRLSRSRSGVGGGAGSGAAAEQVSAAAVDAKAAAEGQIYKESPSQMALASKNMETMLSGNAAAIDKLYEDIPEVANANRKIVNGIVEVGSKGAPKVSGNLPYAEATQVLRDRGVPGQVIRKMERSHGIDSVQQIGELVKNNPGATYINNGAEGLVMNWSESRVIRIQYGPGEPPPSYYLGKAGAYPDWIKKYGGSAVEMKEKVWETAYRIGAKHNSVSNQLAQAARSHGGYSYLRSATIDKTIKRAVGNKVRPADAHANNWAVDFKGRLRAIDPGAYVPPGAPILGGR